MAGRLAFTEAREEGGRKETRDEEGWRRQGRDEERERGTEEKNLTATIHIHVHTLTWSPLAMYCMYITESISIVNMHQCTLCTRCKCTLCKLHIIILTHVIAILQVVEEAAEEVFLFVKPQLPQLVNTLALAFLQ